MTDVTQLLEAAKRGDQQAAAELLPLVYDELRKLVAARMASEKPGHFQSHCQPPLDVRTRVADSGNGKRYLIHKRTHKRVRKSSHHRIRKRTYDRVPKRNRNRNTIRMHKSNQERVLTAKHKLNSAYFGAAFIIATILGGLTGSWLVFFIALAVIMASQFHDGSLRL